MTTEEKQAWSNLEQMIDVEKYRASQPLVYRQLGFVTQVSSTTFEVKWIDETTEKIPLQIAPSGFAGFKEGQWFEAGVERSRRNRELRKVLDVVPKPPVKPLNKRELKKIFKSLPTTAGLPVRDWDEL
jgi:hypothetical protein